MLDPAKSHTRLFTFLRFLFLRLGTAKRPLGPSSEAAGPSKRVHKPSGGEASSTAATTGNTSASIFSGGSIRGKGAAPAAATASFGISSGPTPTLSMAPAAAAMQTSASSASHPAVSTSTTTMATTTTTVPSNPEFLETPGPPQYPLTPPPPLPERRPGSAAAEVVAVAYSDPRGHSTPQPSRTGSAAADGGLVARRPVSGRQRRHLPTLEPPLPPPPLPLSRCSEA